MKKKILILSIIISITILATTAFTYVTNAELETTGISTAQLVGASDPNFSAADNAELSAGEDWKEEKEEVTNPNTPEERLEEEDLAAYNGKTGAEGSIEYSSSSIQTNIKDPVNNAFNNSTNGSSAESIIEKYTLKKYINAFCVKHNKGLTHAGSPYVSSGQGYININMNNYIKFDKNTPIGTNPTLTKDTWYDRCEHNSPESHSASASNFNVITWRAGQNLKTLEDYNFYGRVNPSYNVIPYAISFNDRTSASTSYSSTAAQKAVWQDTGDTVGENKLYKAGKAVDDFESELLKVGATRDGNNDINYAKVLPKITIGANAGTTISSDESTYRVGPFKMSNYAYAYSENVKDYSGKNVANYKGLVGGIDEMTLYFSGDDGSYKALTVSSGAVKIVYQDWYGRATEKGESHRNTGSYTTTIPTAEDIFPAPKSTFYIDIPRSSVGNNITTLLSIKTSYRITKTTGTGDVLIVRYARTSWDIKDLGAHEVDTYYCTAGGGGCSFSHSCYSKGSPYHDHCTHSWYSGCWTTWHTGTRSYTGSDGKTHTYTYRYSVHHHGTYHSVTYSPQFRCRHGFRKCCVETWKANQPTTGYGQPIMIAVASTTVKDYRPVTYCNIRLTTAITVKKYVEEIKHETNNYVTFGDKTTAANPILEATQKPADRFKMTDNQKAQDPTYAEYGDIITYRIDIINEQKYGVNIKLLDTLPEDVVVLNREFLDNQWLRIPTGKLEKDYVAASYRITVRTEANDDGVYVNDVEIITKNLSVSKNSSTNVNFIRTRDSRHGPVVNINELGAGKNTNLNSKDYFKINDYSISIDKYISQYSGEKTIENNNNDFTDETNNLEDRKNKTNTYKTEKAFPVEKGETFTYTINLLNTSTKGSGNKVATQVRPSETVDILDEGLEIIGINGYIKRANGTIKKTLGTTDFSRDGELNGTSKITLKNMSGSTYLILDPTDYVSYEIRVRVTKSNMYLYQLVNTANISVLSNINNGANSTEATIPCQNCSGTGKQSIRTICNYCGGTGSTDGSVPCTSCNGKKDCTLCKGTGKIQVRCGHVDTDKTYSCSECGYDYPTKPSICIQVKTDENGNPTTGKCGSTVFTYLCTEHNSNINNCTHFQSYCNTCNATFNEAVTTCTATHECTSTDVTIKCKECGKNPKECTHYKYVCADCGYESTTAFTTCPKTTTEKCNNTMYATETKDEWICDKCGYSESYYWDDTMEEEPNCPNNVEKKCGSTKVCKICTLCNKEVDPKNSEVVCANCNQPIDENGKCGTENCETKIKVTCNNCEKSSIYGAETVNEIDLEAYEKHCNECKTTQYSSDTTKYCGVDVECGSTDISLKCTDCNQDIASCTHTKKVCASCSNEVDKTTTVCEHQVEQHCNSTEFKELCQKCGSETNVDGIYETTCTACSGMGKVLLTTGDTNDCAECEGHGTLPTKVVCTHCSGIGVYITENKCSGCNGTGHVIDGSNGDRIVRTANGSINRNTNPQESSSEYVKMKDLVIAGKVWLDRDKDGYMGSRGDGNLQTGSSSINVEANPSTYISDTTGKEYAMKGIIVKLYKEDGTLVRTTKTDENGLFTFGRKEDGETFYAGEYSRSENSVVESEERIDKATGKDTNKNYTSNSQLINYYVEYEYDGLVYKSTEIYSGSDNLNSDGSFKEGAKYMRDSNAYELASVREDFNKNFEIVSFNKATNDTQSDTQVLEYDKQNHNSYIVENNNRKMTARSFINTDTQTTNYLWLYQLQSVEKPETEYLKYINLGLEEREDVDISITQDVYELKTTINGEEMIYEYNQNNYTLGNNAIDKEQEKDSQGNETDYSKSFNSERFITGYKNDTDSVEENKVLYNFQYYLEDYNYRVSQYHADTVRAYKGSSLRDFNANAKTTGESILVANSVGRESELNTEITFRIKVTNNVITNDEPFKETEEDIAVYTGINEMVEYYDKDFVNLIFDENGTVKGFNVKTKDSNDYLVNKEIKVVSAKAVMSDGTEREVTLSNNSKYNATRTINNYDTLYITPTVENTHTNTVTGQGIKAGDMILSEGESLDILITFVVEKEVDPLDAKEIRTILGAKENVAEISAYSTYYKDGDDYKSAGLVDKDSNPGNFGEAYGGVTDVDSKEYIKYFEDDTFKTGITLNLPTNITIPPPPGVDERNKEFVQRTLSGFVWDDARSEEAKDDQGTQYIGNGIYTEGDSADKANEAARRNEAVSNKEINDIKVQDVKTELIEVIRMPDPDDATKERIYEDTIYVNGETGDYASVMTDRTDSNGKYKFSGYIPGEYIVRFTYGDDKSKENMLIFNGQDYKSTTYQGGEAVYAENATANGDMTARDVRLQILEKANTSDAKDDEIRRLETIGYSETMNNNKDEILKGKNSSDKIALVDNTYMFADTTDFLVRPEKKYEKVTVLKFAEHNKIITEITRYARFKIENIDFGLQYRPELQLTLNKYISNIKVTTSDTNGTNSKEPLIDAHFDAFYGVVKNTDYVTGATDFVTDDAGNVIEVQADGSDIESKLGSKLNLAQKNNDGSYVTAVAGTELNENTSVGLQNLQYLPNEYIKDSNGNQVIEEKDGKYLIKTTQGFAYIVIDDNLLQGSTISIKYLFTGTNISEIDRIASNLSDLRFKENKEVEKYAKTGAGANGYYDEYTYQVNSIDEKPTFVDQNYSAARTARNALFSEYFRYELDGSNIKTYANGEKIVYQVKAKDFVASDSDKIIAIQDIKKNPEANNPHSGMTGYYGRYLGSTYYTGKISSEEVVAELKLDKVLDYIDNDLVFNNDDNKTENNLWKTTTSKELYNEGLLNAHSYTYFDDSGKKVTDNTITNNYKLLDAEDRAYDTDERSNLALSLDDRVRDDYTDSEEDTTVNKEFSKFLLPRYSNSLESFGTISLLTSKVLSPEDKTDDMTYENIAEIIQYTSVTGRITNLATTIGNVKIEDVHRNKNESPEFYEGRTESDTASVERVTLTPPTGLSSINQVVRDVVEGASYTVIVIIVVGLVCVGITVGITLYHKRRIK